VPEEQQELAHTIRDCNCRVLLNESNRVLQRESFVDIHINTLDKMSSIFRTELWPALRDILFPLSCLACGAGLKGCQDISFCQVCLQNVRLIRAPFCTTCGKPFDNSTGENHLCGYCLKHEWNFTRARAVVCYQAPVAEAVKVFKYSGKMHGLETFAALTRQYYLHHPLPEPDLILPVPLHPKRLRKRGFNQALVLGRKLFPGSKERIDPHVLERHKWTCPQTGLKGAERRRNVKNAFRVKNTEKIKNKKVLLVDDVLTTGATVNECARILLKSKAADVEVFTFARAIHRQI
jgi:ComF family protein